MGDVASEDADAFPVKIARGPSKTDPVETLLVSPATEWESAKLAACAAAALDPDAHRLLLVQLEVLHRRAPRRREGAGRLLLQLGAGICLVLGGEHPFGVQRRGVFAPLC